MKNLKKLLAVIVSICVLATFTVPAFAAETAKTDAEICAELGVLEGEGSGVTAEYLAKGTTRLQAALLYLRLIGKEDEARAFTGTETFADAKEVGWTEGENVLAYLKANPDLGWIGDGTNFDPNDAASAQMIYKVALEALGYKQDVDFLYADVITFAATKGLAKVAAIAKLTNNSTATALVEVLKAKVKDGTKTLAEDLVAKNIISATVAEELGLYTSIPATLEVKSVSAVNLKEIVVVFNKAVDKVSAETAAKYTAAAGKIKSASLADDGVTVTLLLDGDIKLTNQTESKLSITNVKAAADETTVSVKDYKFIPLDNTLPTISSVVSLGNSALKVTFSEPVGKAVSTMFKIDDKSFYGTPKVDGRVVVLKPYNASTILTTGSHKLTVSKVEDFFGLKSLEESVTFDVVEDKAAPTVVGIDATLEEAKVTMSEDVDPNTVATGDIYFKSGSVKKYPKSVSVSGAIITADFSNNALPAYETSLFVEGISDYSGNKMSAAEIKIVATVDQTRPEITDVKVASDNKSIKVTYSKNVNGNEKADYSIKDKDSKTVPIRVIDGTAPGREFTIQLYNALPAGTNTLSISGVDDSTTLHNVILPYTTTIEVGDTKAPEVDSVTGNGHSIIIGFTKTMDMATVALHVNYFIKFRGTMIQMPSSAEFLPTASGKGVIITLPEKIDGYAVEVGPGKTVTEIQVMSVKDEAGNLLLNGYALRDITVGPAKVKAYGGGVTENAILADGKTIKVKFDSLIGVASEKDFSLNSAWATEIVDVDVDESDLVVLNLADDVGTEIPSGATLSIKSDNGMRTVTGNTVAGSAVTIKDKIAPKIKTRDNGTAAFRLSQTTGAGVVTIAVPFTEALDTTTIANFALDLTVTRASDNKVLTPLTDYNVTGVDATNSIITITLKPAAVKTSLYTIAVKDGAAYIKDTAGNAAASSDTFETDGMSDKTAPLAERFVLDLKGDAPETITISFDEELGLADGVNVTGFSIAADAAATAEYDKDTNKVTLTASGDNKFTLSTVVKYTNASGNVIDVYGNELADIAGAAVE